MIADKFLSLDDQQIKYLICYNLIHKNKSNIEYAEEFERYMENSKDIVKIKLNSIKSEVEDEIKTLSFFSFLGNPSTRAQPVKIYMDGVFDIIHSGHFNAIRQSKKLGDILIVGVNSDSDVEKSKGPTLMNIKERSALARACKWVDIVLEDTPYTPTVQFLKDIGADYCAHGDDMPINEHGIGCYDEIKEAGMLKVFKRTEGISTTEIIGRLLSFSTSRKSLSSESKPITSTELVKQANEEKFQLAPIMSNFLSTSWRITEFCNNRVPNDNDKVIYIDGSFDILHIGHIEILKRAKELGDFLYVGVHDDNTINKHRGKNYPVLNLQERTFNLLALKYVDEVIIGAPWVITEDLIKSLKIDLVVQGSNSKYDEFYELKAEEEDPYHVPKKMGIYKEIESTYELNNEMLVNRILSKRDVYMKKYQKKSIKEIEYYKSKIDSDLIKEI